MHFRLNSDQEFVLNEVTKWFLPKKKKKGDESKESQSDEPKEQNDDFDIIGMEDAISEDDKDTKHIK